MLWLIAGIVLLAIAIAGGAIVHPVLFVLGKPAPLGLPSWIGLLSPVIAGAMVALASLAWRGGLRRYRSTGS